MFPWSVYCSIFEHKEDAEIDDAGGASSLLILMPTSTWEVFFKQTSDVRCPSP